MTTLMRDVRYGVRMLIRNPFTIITVMTPHRYCGNNGDIHRGGCCVAARCRLVILVVWSWSIINCQR